MFQKIKTYIPKFIELMRSDNEREMRQCIFCREYFFYND